jgi:hypothetical protein
MPAGRIRVTPADSYGSSWCHDDLEQLIPLPNAGQGAMTGNPAPGRRMPSVGKDLGS